MAPHQYHSWQAWHEALLQPCLPEPCGEDLIYDERFKTLKASSSGVAEYDFKRLFVLASELAEKESKDFRVLSYLMLAASSEFGMTGLLASFKLLNDSAQQFAEALYPRKEKARLAVHHWFLQQQERLKGICEHKGNIAAADWHELRAELTRYRDSTLPLLDKDAGPLATLQAWVEQGCKQNPIAQAAAEVRASEVPATSNPIPVANAVQAEQVTVAQSAAVAMPVQNTVRAETPVVSNLPPATDISSDSQFLAVVRSLLSHDKEAKNYLRMMMLARAARWGSLIIPPHDANGNTRVPAPRETALAPINHAKQQGHFEQALVLAENVFMEGAMQFNLDLQHNIVGLLRQAQLLDAAKWLEHELSGLLARFPMLGKLKYDNGQAFCSAKTAAWLEELAAVQSATDTSTSEVDSLLEAEQTAYALVDQGEVAQALQTIAILPNRSAFDAAQLQLLRAKILLRNEQYALAQPLFEQLLEQIEQHQLARWQQAFALQVWRFAKRCFAGLSQTSDDEFSVRAKAIETRMLVTDTATAIAWL
ncbi:type VI secretion system domain-containing protein [Pseudoalteromonas fenneropenaei]|uniref:Type VI secretion system domain-containing protein n=1 Tax=Pseudoalteromonas fenneropenaei TaxID=1737459 RepID=A0ABV7CHN5_9GAMM